MNSAQSFYDLVESRRSVRSFTSEPIPRAALDRALDAALRAPSSSNLQLWRFVVVETAEARAELARACLSQPPANTAPALVALVARPRAWRETREGILRILERRNDLNPGVIRYYRRLVPLFYVYGVFNTLGWLKPWISRVVSLFRPFPLLPSKSGVRLVAHKSAALAGATFMLALRAEGFDSCPMEGFDPWRAQRALKLPAGEEVSIIFAVGKIAPDAKIRPRALLPRETTVVYRT